MPLFESKTVSRRQNPERKGMGVHSNEEEHIEEEDKSLMQGSSFGSLFTFDHYLVSFFTPALP